MLVFWSLSPVGKFESSVQVKLRLLLKSLSVERMAHSEDTN